MTRRKFVKSLGTSTIFSALTFTDRNVLAALNAASPRPPLGAQNPTAREKGPANPVWPRPIIVPIPTDGGRRAAARYKPGRRVEVRADPSPGVLGDER